MRTSAHVIHHDTLVINVPRETPRALAQQIGEDVAELVEQRIAEDFEGERAAGKALRGYSEEHEQRKAREGLLMEKGHMTGELQNELDAGGFARISVHPGKISIKWREQDLIDRVGHAEFYAEEKVPGGRILVVLKKDAATAEKYAGNRIAEGLSQATPGRRATPRLRVTPRELGTGVRI